MNSFNCTRSCYNRILLSTRYEEAEVRKKLEEKDRREEEQLQQQKKQEAGREDSGAVVTRSSENVSDSKNKTQRVLQLYCETLVLFAR